MMSSKDLNLDDRHTMSYVFLFGILWARMEPNQCLLYQKTLILTISVF